MKKFIKTLLFCGIIIPIFYIGIDAVSAMLYEGYSYRDQAISELSAIGAPTAWLWTIVGIVYNPLLFAFGFAVLKSASENKSLRTAGYLMMASAILSYGWMLFPMNMRGSLGGATDTGHLVMSGLTVLFMSLFISFASGVNGKWFRVYSILAIIMMIGFAGYAGMQAPRMLAQLPTPWMGIMERIGVFSPMIWMAVLAGILLMRKQEAPINKM